MGGTFISGNPDAQRPAAPLQQYRSEIFQDRGEFGKYLVYWSIETSADKSTGLLRQHEIHASCRMSSPLGNDIDIRAALLLIAEKEAEAIATLKPADLRKYDVFMNAGEEFHRADTFRQHPVYLADQRVEALKQKAGNGRFKLKPSAP